MSKFLESRKQGEQEPSVPAQAGWRSDRIEEHLVSLRASSSFAAEQYRVLRHIVEQMHKESGLRVLAVTSAAVGDGKTTTAINLAGALAQSPEARVLLVDADVRRGSVQDYLGRGGAGSAGLVDAILDPSLRLADVVRPYPPPFSLSVLPAGRGTPTPYEVLKSPRVGDLFEDARQHYDYVVLDTPPVVPIPDCRVIAKWIDGFFLIVAAHKTPRKLVEAALDIIDPAKLVGLVFNGDDRPFSGYSSYYSAYGESPNGHRTNWWSRVSASHLFRTDRTAG
jgi:capsular exopolysaccharide synthesis family protein